MRKFNIVLSVIVSIIFILLAFFCFDISYKRAAESCLDFGRSVKFFFCELLELEHDAKVTVMDKSKLFEENRPSDNPPEDIPPIEDPPVEDPPSEQPPADEPPTEEMPDEDFSSSDVLPPTYGDFKFTVKEYFNLLFSENNFRRWLYKLSNDLNIWCRILVIIIPVIIMLFIVVKMMYFSHNVRHNVDTVPLKIYKVIVKYTFIPVKSFVLQYVDFLLEYKLLFRCWLLIWLLNFNFITIIIEFLAFYFYFAMSFNFSDIYVQILKLIQDLSVFFGVFPVWTLIIFIYPFFDGFRRKIADDVLRHYEARNCGFIKSLPVVTLVCGTMGKNKTTMITDMTLSQEVMFRQDSLEIVQKKDFYFPYFPWISLEDEIYNCVEHHTIYNLATVKDFVLKKKLRFLRHGDVNLQLYGYDIDRYGRTCNDGLSEIDLFDVIGVYSEAYFLYSLDTSLIVSNYSIRTDNVYSDYGNFPLWSYDFFPDEITVGKHSHILDFDTLRPGKKIVRDNPRSGSFEFGVLSMTEIGKERGNFVELQGVKKNSDECNQKNDLFNSDMKMRRHSSTIDYNPFFKVFMDEQRADSLGADFRQLSDIIQIEECSDVRLALPFYTIEDMISDWIFSHFKSFYLKMRSLRGDNTLLIYILKGVTSFVFRRNARVYNKYGFKALLVSKEHGNENSDAEKNKYFLMNRKIYSKRFSTDCYSDYFNDVAKKTNIGLKDYPEYATEKATVEELKMQNSYFINDLYKDS